METDSRLVGYRIHIPSDGQSGRFGWVGMCILKKGEGGGGGRRSNLAAIWERKARRKSRFYRAIAEAIGELVSRSKHLGTCDAISGLCSCLQLCLDE